MTDSETQAISALIDSGLPHVFIALCDDEDCPDGVAHEGLCLKDEACVQPIVLISWKALKKISDSLSRNENFRQMCRAL